MPETKPRVKGLGMGDPEYRNDRFDYWESLDRIPISKKSATFRVSINTKALILLVVFSHLFRTECNSP